MGVLFDFGEKQRGSLSPSNSTQIPEEVEGEAEPEAPQLLLGPGPRWSQVVPGPGTEFGCCS